MKVRRVHSHITGPHQCRQKPPWLMNGDFTVVSINNPNCYYLQGATSFCQQFDALLLSHLPIFFLITVKQWVIWSTENDTLLVSNGWVFPVARNTCRDSFQQLGNVIMERGNGSADWMDTEPSELVNRIMIFSVWRVSIGIVRRFKAAHSWLHIPNVPSQCFWFFS